MVGCRRWQVSAHRSPQTWWGLVSTYSLTSCWHAPSTCSFLKKIFEVYLATEAVALFFDNYVSCCDLNIIQWLLACLQQFSGHKCGICCLCCAPKFVFLLLCVTPRNSIRPSWVTKTQIIVVSLAGGWSTTAICKGTLRCVCLLMCFLEQATSGTTPCVQIQSCVSWREWECLTSQRCLLNREEWRGSQTWLKGRETHTHTGLNSGKT